MTEAEWLACADPTPMRKHVAPRATDRKLRLFAVAYCRRLWHLLTDERSRKAVECVERFADGVTGEEERIKCARAAHSAKDRAAHVFPPTPFTTAALLAYLVCRYDGDSASANVVYFAAGTDDWYFAGGSNKLPNGEAPAQVGLLRCIFGNPFRPLSVDPSWRTSTVAALARGIYDDRAFDRLPILADALQDAGCNNADILNHCRGDGPHVRGCFVVDHLLGKE